MQARRIEGRGGSWAFVVFLWLGLALGGNAAAQSREFNEVKHRAEGGDAEAQFELAVMYDQGVGAPRSYAESGKWYLKAASAGVAEAQFQLGVRYYEHGKNAKEHFKSAFSWFYQAANQGLPEAQYNVGLMHEAGEGTSVNKVEAHRWYNLAAAQGNERALRARERLAGAMTRQELAESERRAAAFTPRRTFKDLGGVPGPGAERPKASGTGFFVSDDGYLVTNLHVVESAGRCVVRTKRGNFNAAIVRRDAANDLALLKVTGAFRALPLAASREVKLGEAVFTIGFPNVRLQGVEPKLTRGDISSLAGMQDDARFFQISVPVQPGNSGGPLVNLAGAVVGVVTMRLGDLRAWQTTGALPQNVNYALKSAHVATLLEGLPGFAAARGKPPGADGRFEDVVQGVQESVALVVIY